MDRIEISIEQARSILKSEMNLYNSWVEYMNIYSIDNKWYLDVEFKDIRKEG